MEEIKLNVGGVTLNVSKDIITQGIEKGELNIETTDLVIKPKADFDIYIANAKKEDYERGKQVGSEMMIKEAREKHGLSFEGKTIDNFADALKKKVLEESKIEPTKKITELETDKEKLQNIVKDLENKHNAFLQIYETEKKQGKIDRELLNKLPKEGLTISNDDLLLLIKNKIEFDIDNGQVIIKKDGNILKNQNTLNPMTLDEMLPDLIKPYITQRKGGAGDHGTNGTGASTIEAFIKEMTTHGIHQGSIAFNQELAKRIKSGQIMK